MEEWILVKLEKDKFLRRWLELNPYGISIYDKDGYFLYNNMAHHEMFQATPPPDYNVFEDPQAAGTPNYLELFEKLWSGEVVHYPEIPYNTHMSYPSAPITDIYMKTVMFPLKNDDGEITNYVSIHEDVTKRKKAELKLEELRRQLENRVKQRTIMLESSEKKFRKAYNRANCFKGLFTHDISNILQVSGNALEYCEIILEKNGDVHKVLEHFQLIKNQINRGKKLIKNIMNLSEMEQSDMHIEPVNINRNLNEALDFLSINFPHKTINTEIKDNGKEFYVQANELLLDVFENILINAVRYNKSEEIQIIIKISELREDNRDYIKLEFKDNGIGIQDSFKNQIFDKSFDNLAKKKGLGLGLSLVAKLLELCEGNIWVEDRVQGDYTQGSNFIILLPKSEPI